MDAIYYVTGYNNYYFNEYKKVLEFIPSNKEKIFNQCLDNQNILISCITKFVSENSCEKYIVSLSGGVDSMVLVTILKYIGCNVIGIHINYNHSLN